MATQILAGSTAIPMLAENDLQEARRFWHDTLGLEEVWADTDYGEVVFKAGKSVFGLYEHAGGSKADHSQLMFQVPDVPQAKQQLEQAGVTFQEYDLPGLHTQNGIADMGYGSQAAWFLDPGGNIIGLITESPRMIEAMGGQSQTVGAGTGF